MNNTCQNSSRNRQAGAAAVELALVLVFMMLLVGGLVEFGRIFWYYDAMAKATRDGARYLSDAAFASPASPPLDTSGAATLTSNAVVAAGIAAGDFSVSVECDGATCPNPAAPGYVPPNYVTVTVIPTGAAGTIGSWIPIFIPGGGTASFAQVLSPSTTMRYMGG